MSDTANAVEIPTVDDLLHHHRIVAMDDRERDRWVKDFMGYGPRMRVAMMHQLNSGPGDAAHEECFRAFRRHPVFMALPETPEKHDYLRQAARASLESLAYMLRSLEKRAPARNELPPPRPCSSGKKPEEG